jgi:hypothetical protein
MSPSARKSLRAAVALFLALAPCSALANEARLPMVIAQASDEEEIPERQRGVLVEDGEAAEPANPAPFAGEVRTADPFDIDDRAPATPPIPFGSPKDVVICEAGCDGPPGAIVYRNAK